MKKNKMKKLKIINIIKMNKEEAFYFKFWKIKMFLISKEEYLLKKLVNEVIKTLKIKRRKVKEKVHLNSHKI